VSKLAVSKINTYQYGTTVRFEVSFYDLDNVPIEPDSVKIIIYNQKYEQIYTEVLTTNNQVGIGNYFYDYVTPSKEQKLYYEWYGTINGKPSLKRGTFMTKFMV
jgi:hypothetical protein